MYMKKFVSKKLKLFMLVLSNYDKVLHFIQIPQRPQIISDSSFDSCGFMSILGRCASESSIQTFGCLVNALKYCIVKSITSMGFANQKLIKKKLILPVEVDLAQTLSGV